MACAVAFLGAALPLLDPEPPQAKATNIPCLAVEPASVVTEAVGIGSPVSDACDAVTDPVLGVAGKVLDPLKDAASSIGKGVFNQVTAWVADGAVWLIGEVAVLSDKTTSPNLLSKGFLRQYRLMALIAAFMAALMLIFAVFEALGRGDLGMLWRVFLINVPLAAIATSAAYVVVQLLVVTCDGLCQAISQSTGADAREFFKGAVEALAEVGAVGGAAAGAQFGGPGLAPSGAASGAIGVPLFVGFIAAIVAAFAAFFVWIELLMRDAAIYVVALFMPMAIAASIWPRWVSALKRTCELVVVIVFSKFVIVAIISLAASLLAKNEGAVEQVLAAGAMLLLACFAPFLLFKLVPFAEGAVASAYHRQGAGGGAMRGMQVASDAQRFHRVASTNWSKGEGGSKGGGSSGSASKSRSSGGKAAGSSGASSGGEAVAAAGGGPAGVAAIGVAGGVAAAKTSQGAAQRLTESGVADEAGEAGGGSAESGASTSDQSGSAETTPRPPSAEGTSGASQGGGASGGEPGNKKSQTAAQQAEPSEAGGGSPGSGASPPRPSAGKDAGSAKDGK